MRLMLVLGALLVTSVCAQDFHSTLARSASQRYENQLNQATDAYRQQTRAGRKKFVTEMQALRNHELTAGHLEIVNQIEALIKLSPMTRPAPMPPGCEPAYQHFESAVVKAADQWTARVTPIRKQFKTDLLEAKSAAMKRADLDEANAIEAAVKALDAAPSTPVATHEVLLCDVEPTSYVGNYELGRHGLWHRPAGAELLVSVNGDKYPNALFTDPSTKTRIARATYDLSKRFDLFSGKVAIDDATKNSPKGGKPAFPITFIITGDGKLLWHSRPLQTPGETDEFSVPVSDVKELALIVQCDGSPFYEGPAWLDLKLSAE